MQQAIGQIGVAFGKIRQTKIGIAEIAKGRSDEPDAKDDMKDNGLETLDAYPVLITQDIKKKIAGLYVLMPEDQRVLLIGQINDAGRGGSAGGNA